MIGESAQRWTRPWAGRETLTVMAWNLMYPNQTDNLQIYKIGDYVDPSKSGRRIAPTSRFPARTPLHMFSVGLVAFSWGLAPRWSSAPVAEVRGAEQHLAGAGTLRSSRPEVRAAKMEGSEKTKWRSERILPFLFSPFSRCSLPPPWVGGERRVARPRGPRGGAAGPALREPAAPPGPGEGLASHVSGESARACSYYSRLK